MRYKIPDRITSLSPEVFTFLTLTFFYFSLWFFNPSKYFVIAGFFILGGVFYLKTKNFKFSLLMLALSSHVVFSGKSYFIEILPPGAFDKDIFPSGYVLPFVINIGQIVSAVLLIVIVRELFTKTSKYKPNKIDLMLFLYFLWKLLSDIFGSQAPEVSVLFYLSSLPTLIAYFYIRTNRFKPNSVLPFVGAIFLSLITFQSVISYQQYLAKSPLGKTIEFQRNIEYVGNVDDELGLQYSYRPAGTFDHANTLGIYQAFWLSFIIIVYLKTRRKEMLYITCLGIISLAMTLSRSAWLGFAAGLLTTIYILEKIKKIKIKIPDSKYIIFLVITSLPLMLFFILPRIANSSYAFLQGAGGGTLRMEQLKAAVQIIPMYPIFGVGENQFPIKALEMLPQSIFSSVALDIHNWYISVIANHGIPTFLFILGFVLLSTKSVFEKITKSGKSLNDFVNIWYVGMMVTFLTASFFTVSYGEYYIALFSAILNNEKGS